MSSVSRDTRYSRSWRGEERRPRKPHALAKEFCECFYAVQDYSLTMDIGEGAWPHLAEMGCGEARR